MKKEVDEEMKIAVKSTNTNISKALKKIPKIENNGEKKFVKKENSTVINPNIAKIYNSFYKSKRLKNIIVIFFLFF